MEINKLTNDQAVRAVHFLAARWLEKDGVAVQVALQDVRKRAAKGSVELPPWANNAMKVNKTNGDMCRSVLEAITAGDDKRAREWARGAVARATQPAGHVEPLTTLLVGTFLIGLILACRVKRVRIGSVEVDFFEGVPKETVEIIEKAAGAITPKV